MLLGRLRGLKQLTVAFQGNFYDGSPVCIAPLSQLTNLELLIVQGVVPSAAQVLAAAAVKEGGGAASGEHGGISNSCCFLPISMTSLELQGGGWDNRGKASMSLKGLMDHMPSGNQLEELHVRNFSSDAFRKLFSGVDLSSLPLLKALHVLMEPPLRINEMMWVNLPLSLLSLSNLEVLEPVSSSKPELPGPQSYFILGRGQEGLLNHLPKLRKLCWVLNAEDLEVPAEAQLSQLEQLCCYGVLPACLTASMCPQLQRVMVAGEALSEAFQGLAAYTQLTALRLDGSVAHCMFEL